MQFMHAHCKIGAVSQHQGMTQLTSELAPAFVILGASSGLPRPLAAAWDPHKRRAVNNLQHPPWHASARQLTMGMGWPRRLLSSSRVSSKSTSLTANSQVPATQHDILQGQWHLHLSEGVAGNVTTALQQPAPAVLPASYMQAVLQKHHNVLLQLQPCLHANCLQQTLRRHAARNLAKGQQACHNREAPWFYYP